VEDPELLDVVRTDAGAMFIVVSVKSCELRASGKHSRKD
jgi:hypothetical protein